MRAMCSDGMPTPVSDTSTIPSWPSTARRNRQPAALGHRVAGVEEQIEKDLLQLVFDATHDDRRRAKLAPDLDLGHLELRLEQRRDVADDDVADRPGPFRLRTGRARFSRLFTIFAARNVCCSIFSSSCVLRIVGRRSLEQHLRERRDAGERRVHFVRDAGGEQADRRHLLRQPQLLFEVGALGHVLEHDDPAGLRRAVGLKRRDGDVHEEVAPLARHGVFNRHAEQRRARRAPRAARRQASRRTAG